jgi:hypothetical protein
MNTCILLSTCDKYIPLADLTIDLLGQRWANHPPIFVCGVSTDFTSRAELLTLRSDPGDWIGITRLAVDDLLKLGYRKCYLILEDHPPLAICHQTHLNETLPALMDRLGAVYIGLYGWDQGTLSAGTVLPSEYHGLQQQADTFLWRFSLHPALWNLEALRDVIAMMPIPGNDMSMQSIWAFERRSGSIQNNEVISPRLQGRSYRVFGSGMLAGRFRTVRALCRRLYFFILNAMLWLVGKLFGTAVQEWISNALLPDRLFFDGPYPLYWSGVMQKGRLNQNFEKFLLRRKRIDELDDFRRIIGQQG